jgi:hypothetical protein
MTMKGNRRRFLAEERAMEVAEAVYRPDFSSAANTPGRPPTKPGFWVAQGHLSLQVLYSQMVIGESKV